MHQYFIYSPQQPYQIEFPYSVDKKMRYREVNNLFKVTQLVNGQTKFQSQSVRLQSSLH